MGKWLRQLAKITEKPLGMAPTKPTKPPSVGFVGTSRRGLTEKSGDNGGEVQDLHNADLSIEELEAVVDLMLQPADKIAEKLQRSLFEVDPEVGLAGTDAQELVHACWACGNDAWWSKSCGERVCGICHPRPNRGMPI